MLRKQLSQFNRLMQSIEKVYEDYAKSAGLTFMSLTVLQIISNAEKPCTQKEICGICHYNKQVVNTIVKGFYDRGYIEFCEVPDDRRNKHIHFTEKGRAYAVEILRPLHEMEEKALTVLTKEERELMLSMLGRCYDGYKAAQERLESR